MNGFNAMQILMMLAAAASFWGLCVFTRDRFRLDAALAPFATACGIMVLLMLGGMARILLPVWYILFAGGYIQLGYCCIVRRKQRLSKWEWLMPAAVLAAALVYGLWRFSGEYYVGNDSFSQWGVAAKYLVRMDKFPDRTTNVIFFQTYPLGTACFIYFFTRLAGWSEGLSLCVHFLLNTLAFMPVLSAIKKNRAAGLAASAMVYLFIVCYGVPVNQVQVDTLMGIMAIGAAASICRYRNDEKRILALGMLYSAMFVFVKSSGVFFSAVIAAYGLYAVRMNRKDKAGMIRAALMFAGSIALAYVLWNLHVRLAYEHGMDTKHAVSLSSYAEELRNKQLSTVAVIAVQMLRRMFPPQRMYIVLLIAAAALALSVYLMVRNREGEAEKWLPLLKRTILACAVVLAVWYAMLFFMYVFSMPVDTAVTLASFGRYERTTHVFIIGAAWLFALSFFFREDFTFSFAERNSRIACILAVFAFLCVCAGFAANDDTAELVKRIGIEAQNQYVENFRENYDIQEEAGYIVLFDSAERSIQYVHHVVKHEFLSSDLLFVCKGTENWELDPGAYYFFRNITANSVDYDRASGIYEVLEEYAGRYDYILVLDQDPEYESALAEYQINYPDARIAYGYK